MSGHSKWDTIKHKKALNDAKKGKSFSKVSVQITHAARQGGGDPNMNPTLRLYIDKAKAVGFSNENVEKAIKKGTGEGSEGIIIDEITYEGFGPHDVQLIVDVLTDNKNRTVAEIRQLFDGIGGKMGDAGSVSWNFETKGYIEILCGHMEKSPKYGEPDLFVAENPEEVELAVMDLPGILDIHEFEDNGKKGLALYSKFESFGAVRDGVSKLGYVITEAELIKEAKVLKSLKDDELEKVNLAIEKIEENDDVQNVWSNIE
ncbi:YebC/PmpR family DNA-binding transcriptional regulator [Candidatus Dojkabacteria bacterium]|uniref:Probable transcriptional regulatory protein GX656_02510 n=1 Tax=Candidatus Dojkabacteria bacterium TaxID=2099670 RepID=A0A847D0H4_9BACT|nr:YebC/PmpR family DNA-binding transcriptional regulator [Candidatus Dojkabacteria bacterium]